jgi:hypothetical protein
MTHLTQDSAAERWSRLYVDVRASYGRAAIEAALLLNAGLRSLCWRFSAISPLPIRRLV